MSRPSRQEHAPGDPAPETGRYQLINVFGTPTGHTERVEKDTPLPPAPRLFRWVLRPEPPEC